jgi:spermidine/putrescine transport system permease protein
VTGTLLVFIPMMGEYVIPLILGGGRVDFIGNVIQRLFLEAQDYALGSALALLVMGALSFFVALYLYLSTRTEQEYGA